MAYTIGIKRRWLPGYRKITVTGHEWQNWRFILNLTDGSQEHIPGFSTSVLKVYADFWTHLQIERARVAPQRQGASAAPIPLSVPAPALEEVEAPIEAQESFPAPPPKPERSPLELEVERRAAERVRSIQASLHEH